MYKRQVEGSFDALIRHAFSRAVEAVAAFAELTEDSPTSGQQPVRQGAGSIVDGLEVAAQLLNSDLGSRLVVVSACLLYTSDAADERSSVDLGGRRIIKKKK